jgi:hypothetical protein
LDAASLILFKNGQAIQETAYFESADAVRQLPEQVELTSLPESEDFIFGYNNAHSGLSALADPVPAGDRLVVAAEAVTLCTFDPSATGTLAERNARLLGADRIPRLTLQTNTRYHLPRVEYSDFLKRGHQFRNLHERARERETHCLSRAVLPFG